MVRPTFLVVEPEPGNALSTRKLVLETAKFNVLTAHSWHEAEELFDLFPRVNAVIVTNEVDEGKVCSDFVKRVKQRNPRPATVVLAPHVAHMCDDADHLLSSHDPQSLVNLMRSLFGDPRPDDLGP